MPSEPRYPVLLDGGDLDGYEVDLPFALGLCSPFIAVALPPAPGLFSWLKWKLAKKDYRSYKLQCDGRTPNGKYPLPRLGPRFPESLWRGEGCYLLFEPDSGARGYEKVTSAPRPARVKLPHQVKSEATPRCRLSALAERLYA
jgi:hypothetical protein